MTPLIYNLFQRLVGPVTRWPEHAQRAARMGFNWLYLNPWHYPGFSGSLYAPKEFRRLNPLFAPPGADTYDLGPLEQALRRIQDAGLSPMMDLVVNHTSKDALLADEHPEWYVRDPKGELVSPFVVDPDDPEKITVWGDLAEIDNENSPGRDELWDYWAELVRDSLRLGFRGFRCDAAYKVPAELWRHLIEEARSVDPEVKFFAETLGAPVEDVLALREAGFQFIFNSSKWWDFAEPWALDQQEKFRDIAPSISFPETHDTTRVAADSGGSEAVQRQRYAFAAAFSAGVMLPVGYEFGFKRQVNVVHTMPADWERKSFDLTRFVERVNRLKLERPALQGEAALRAANGLEADELLLDRATPEGHAWILVNKRPDSTVQSRAWDRVPRDGTMFRVCRDDAPAEGEPVPEQLTLGPAEVIYVLPG
jgi:starch synthase (maltosyl-transferring)